MCGRYTLSTPADILAGHFGLESAVQTGPRFNIAPSQKVLMIVEHPDRRRAAGLARWGLEGPGQKSGRRRSFINARAETVAERPAFRASLEKRRCLVPAGWQTKDDVHGRFVAVLQAIAVLDAKIFGIDGAHRNVA